MAGEPLPEQLVSDGDFGPLKASKIREELTRTIEPTRTTLGKEYQRLSDNLSPQEALTVFKRKHGEPQAMSSHEVIQNRMQKSRERAFRRLTIKNQDNDPLFLRSEKVSVQPNQ